MQIVPGGGYGDASSDGGSVGGCCPISQICLLLRCAI